MIFKKVKNDYYVKFKKSRMKEIEEFRIIKNNWKKKKKTINKS